MPSAAAARAMRIAISPRFATSSRARAIGERSYTSARAGEKRLGPTSILPQRGHLLGPAEVSIRREERQPVHDGRRSDDPLGGISREPCREPLGCDRDLDRERQDLQLACAGGLT